MKAEQWAERVYVSLYMKDKKNNERNICTLEFFSFPYFKNSLVFLFGKLEEYEKTTTVLQHWRELASSMTFKVAGMI